MVSFVIWYKRAAFISWMQANRGEDPKYLGPRFDRFQWMISARDIFGDANRRGLLMTPREEFCQPANLPRCYDIDFLDIGYGVTISGPGLVGRMTSVLDIKKGDTIWKYGEDIGKAVAAIKTGEHAHVQNIKTKRW